MFRSQILPALAASLFLAGCSGGNGGGGLPPPEPDSTTVPAASAVGTATRKEFVVLRELVKQHGLQMDNAVRREAVERSLKEKFSQLPDKGKTEEERCAFCQAAELIELIGK